GLAQRPIFVPAYGAFRQGIVLTVPLALRLLAPDVDGATLHACLARHYAGAAHVHVLPLHESRALKHLDPQVLNGTNDMHLSVFPNMEHGHVLLSAVFDNLGKGASGAAVQNLNLMLTQQ
ncbi:N-acetyl-gamma-glutamyl-phosphate reductase, partial [Cupriavidus sp. AcVe19-6a]|nr:N-acetyl-gamma-glutamyl-phosphate reductase [Cupriavidus sp. AcVe19-6a]